MALTAQDLRASETRDRLVDAAFHAVERFGLSRFTMDDVARLAGVARQSVYRYFDSKDALIAAVVEREEEAFLEGVRRASEDNTRLEDALREAILFCLRSAREHPLLDRLLLSEPDLLLPFFTTRAEPLIERARSVIEALARARPDVDRRLVPRAADLVVRAILSHVLTPGRERPEAVARETARILAAAIATKGDHR